MSNYLDLFRQKKAKLYRDKSDKSAKRSPPGEIDQDHCRDCGQPPIERLSLSGYCGGCLVKAVMDGRIPLSDRK